MTQGSAPWRSVCAAHPNFTSGEPRFSGSLTTSCPFLSSFCCRISSTALRATNETSQHKIQHILVSQNQSCVTLVWQVFNWTTLAAPAPQQGQGCNLSERDGAKQQRQAAMQPSPDLLSPLVNPHPQACWWLPPSLHAAGLLS